MGLWRSTTPFLSETNSRICYICFSRPEIETKTRRDLIGCRILQIILRISRASPTERTTSWLVTGAHFNDSGEISAMVTILDDTVPRKTVPPMLRHHYTTGNILGEIHGECVRRRALCMIFNIDRCHLFPWLGAPCFTVHLGLCNRTLYFIFPTKGLLTFWELFLENSI